MDEFKKITKNFLENAEASNASFAVIDFSKNSIDSFHMQEVDGFVQEIDGDELFFDLASVTKPLVMGGAFLNNPDICDEKMIQLLEHRAGLPAWGILPRSGWEEIINFFDISSSGTVYSDFSALRFMLELEKKISKPIKEYVQGHWHKEICFWKDLNNQKCVSSGERNGAPILGVVHDPNAYNIGKFCSHAGLFGTLNGVCKTLINFNKEFHLLENIGKMITDDYSNRFVRGWDRAENPKSTLAGSGCSHKTFGHLGFTGTSVWIDPDKKIGHVLLTNDTLKYWYNPEKLNEFRRKIGELVWKNY